MADEMTCYKIIEVMTDISFKHRSVESCDIDNNICTHVKDGKLFGSTVLADIATNERGWRKDKLNER